jgi:hypothetical protein
VLSSRSRMIWLRRKCSSLQPDAVECVRFVRNRSWRRAYHSGAPRRLRTDDTRVSRSRRKDGQRPQATAPISTLPKPPTSGRGGADVASPTFPRRALPGRALPGRVGNWHDAEVGLVRCDAGYRDRRGAIGARERPALRWSMAITRYGGQVRRQHFAGLDQGTCWPRTISEPAIERR